MILNVVGYVYFDKMNDHDFSDALINFPYECYST